MSKKPSLYYLLVGIDEYPVKPLRGCVSDVEKMEAYLQSLSSAKAFKSISPHKLINEYATKTAIVDGIQNHLGRAKDHDVALFYYSGHGANEETGGRFQDELDGLLECIVCHSHKDEKSGFLLADKELRFLFSSLRNSPHLVTVFDSCHAGDMTRADDEVSLKRLSGSFAARDYEEFLFQSEISQQTLEKGSISDLIPNKNHVHIAACLSNESAWEDKGTGVFTSYLLQLLEGTENQINYLDIARYARISLKDMTGTQQTPTVSTLGNGATSHLSSWLNMESEIGNNEVGKITYDKNEWVYTAGRLMGLRKDMDLTIIKDEKEVKTKIKEAQLTISKIEQVPEMEDWDIRKKFSSSTSTMYSPLDIFINHEEDSISGEGNSAGGNTTIASIESIIEEIDNVKLVERKQANFYLNVFNKLVYFSRTGDPFRPIARQFDLRGEKVDMKKFLEDQLKFLVKWNHFNTLQNPSHRLKNPLEVTFHLEGKKDDETGEPPTKLTRDVTENSIEFPAIKQRHPTKGYFYNRYRVNIKNTGENAFYVGILRLGSDLAIDCYGNGETIRLEPGNSFDIYSTKPDKSIRRASFYDYQEVYNWRHEEIIFKFIVNTADFTPEFKDFFQPNIELPYIPQCPDSEEEPHRTTTRSGTFILRPMQWFVSSCSLKMINPSFNQIQGRLKDCPQTMADDVVFGPFIPKLYDSSESGGSNEV